MVASNNDAFVMTKPSGLSKGTGKKQSLRATRTRKYDYIFIDCLSFLGLGLGFEETFHLSKCTSVALIDIDDSSNIFLEDVEMEADSSTRFSDGITLGVPSDETKNLSSTNYEDKKSIYSTPTISTLTMEKFIEGRKVEDETQRQKSQSRLVLSGNLVPQERSVLEDEEESKTLNTRSTSRIPSSLDTKTLRLTPSLDTKTWNVTLAGLELVETTIGDTTEVDIRRNYRSDSHPMPSILYQIERVPSMVDTQFKDDESLVSFMSVEEDIFVPKRSGETSNRIFPTEVHQIRQRLFRAKGKLLRSWSWKKRRLQRKCSESELEPNPTDRLLRKPTSSSTQSEDSSKTTVPAIEPVKSMYTITASTDTNEDNGYYISYGEDVPFDEPIVSPLGFLPIKETRLGQ